jgi:hypothetical protein
MIKCFALGLVEIISRFGQVVSADQQQSLHRGQAMRLFPRMLLAALLAGCATTDEQPAPGQRLPSDMARLPDGSSAKSWPALADERDGRVRIARLLPATVREAAGWAGDLQAAFVHLDIVQSAPTYCAAIAVIEQESSFQADPVVAGLPAIVWRELEQRSGRYGIPLFVVKAALLKNSPDGRSYRERIDTLKTEKQLNALYADMVAELPFGTDLLAGYNPVRTAGPMQVSIDFAERQAREKPYPYKVGKTLRDEVFTRRGGLYFGSAILLDYPAPYGEVLYRFADFNAGRYSSRNAAFQFALGRLAGRPLALDGDLLRYADGQAVDAPSAVESAARSIAGVLRMSPDEIRRDLLLEKTPAFGRSPLFARVFAEAEQAVGKKLSRQAMPRIDLKSPKITRDLTTEWFARRVEERYRNCLNRAAAAGLL